MEDMNAYVSNHDGIDLDIEKSIASNGEAYYTIHLREFNGQCEIIQELFR